MREGSEILRIADELLKKSQEIDTTELDRVQEIAEEMGKSWSGSWLGYQSRVYYKGFLPAPAGARFSIEWGYKDAISNETSGEWREYAFDDVVNAIYQKAGSPDIDRYKPTINKAVEHFSDSQSKILSLLSPILNEQKNDTFLSDIFETIKNEKILTAQLFVESHRPEQIVSRDSIAMDEGSKAPPHRYVIAQTQYRLGVFKSCERLSKHARRVGSHIQNLEKRDGQEERIGTNIFIGHGGSQLWRDLKDFIQERLHLPWDEFNRVPVAGITNTQRLVEMLGSAAIAFLVMTAEDEQVDGKMQARMNVVHEAGLFQGRLGFTRAIVLLEEGCEEFSNIHGLGQIRFSKGNIKEAFEEIRRVLEREDLLVTK